MNDTTEIKYIIKAVMFMILAILLFQIFTFSVVRYSKYENYNIKYDSYESLEKQLLEVKAENYELNQQLERIKDGKQDN